jgi:hypothetical protein
MTAAATVRAPFAESGAIAGRFLQAKVSSSRVTRTPPIAAETDRLLI